MGDGRPNEGHIITSNPSGAAFKVLRGKLLCEAAGSFPSLEESVNLPIPMDHGRAIRAIFRARQIRVCGLRFAINIAHGQELGLDSGWIGFFLAIIFYAPAYLISIVSIEGRYIFTSKGDFRIPEASPASC